MPTYAIYRSFTFLLKLQHFYLLNIDFNTIIWRNSLTISRLNFESSEIFINFAIKCNNRRPYTHYNIIIHRCGAKSGALLMKNFWIMRKMPKLSDSAIVFQDNCRPPDFSRPLPSGNGKLFELFGIFWPNQKLKIVCYRSGTFPVNFIIAL